MRGRTGNDRKGRKWEGGRTELGSVRERTRIKRKGVQGEEGLKMGKEGMENERYKVILKPFLSV